MCAGAHGEAGPEQKVLRLLHSQAEAWPAENTPDGLLNKHLPTTYPSFIYMYCIYPTLRTAQY